MAKLKVGVLGATGMVGQSYIALLKDHPWFEVSFLAASERSAGKRYEEAVEGRWHFEKDIPEGVRGLLVHSIEEMGEARKTCDFVFSALDTAVAKEWEERYAEAGVPVVSNSSAHRWDEDVPMIIPEINPDHLKIIPIQRKKRGWDRGFIAVKPNCSLQSYLIPLFPLHKEFTLKAVIVTTMQAISGAGYPGVASFDIIDNIVPYIKGEEVKSEREPRKILGRIEGDLIVEEKGIVISAHCNRVPVIDGHLACVSVAFESKPTREEILEIWREFRGVPQELNLPFAPEQPIIYREEVARPQPRLDRDKGKGMAVTVGRLRECNVLNYRFVALSHNTIRGAAGGGILIAELLKERGFFNNL